MESELQGVILIFSLLFLAAVISLALKRIRLPFTVVVLLVGLLLGTVAVSYGPAAGEPEGMRRAAPAPRPASSRERGRGPTEG